MITTQSLPSNDHCLQRHYLAAAVVGVAELLLVSQEGLGSMDLLMNKPAMILVCFSN